MKTRPALATAGIALAAYFLGIATAPKLIRSSADRPAHISSPSPSPVPGEPTDPVPPKFRTSDRPDPATDMIPVSRKSIKNLIAGKSFRG